MRMHALAVDHESGIAVVAKELQDWITQVTAWGELGAAHLFAGTGGRG